MWPERTLGAWKLTEASSQASWIIWGIRGESVGVPGVARLEPLHGTGEIRGQARFVDFEMPDDLLKVRIGHLQEFQEEVFQLNVIMRLRKTQTCCRFESAPAGAVQFSYQRLEVCLRHGGCSS